MPRHETKSVIIGTTAQTKLLCYLRGVTVWLRKINTTLCLSFDSCICCLHLYPLQAHTIKMPEQYAGSQYFNDLNTTAVIKSMFGYYSGLVVYNWPEQNMTTRARYSNLVDIGWKASIRYCPVLATILPRQRALLLVISLEVLFC